MLSSDETRRYLREYEKLDERTEKLQSHFEESRKKLTEVERALRPLSRRIAYLRAARFCRSIVENTIVWKPGAVALGALTVGALTLFATGSVTGLVIATVACAVAGSILLWVPSGVMSAADIATTIANLRNDKVTLEAQWDAIVERLNEIDERTTQLESRCDEIETLLSGERRRLQLSHQNWRAMRGLELEAFLVNVFEALGYSVETTSETGDHGVDLIVERRGVRVAIQVKGYTDSVSNSAVQQAYSGMAFYDCDECAVVTNSRFTRNAVAVAEKIGCVLIGEDEFQKLILGQCDIVEIARPSRR